MTDVLAEARAFLESLPYAQSLGMQLIGLGDGKAEIRMPYDTRLIGDPSSGVLHGGAISALMDNSTSGTILPRSIFIFS